MATDQDDFVEFNRMRIARARVALVKEIKFNSSLSRTEVKDQCEFVKHITSRQLQLYYLRLSEPDIAGSDLAFCRDDSDRAIMAGFTPIRARLAVRFVDIMFEQAAEDQLGGQD